MSSLALIPWLDPETIIDAAGPWALLVVCAIIFAETGLSRPGSSSGVGFSWNSVITPSASVLRMPNAEASSAVTGIVATVRSAHVERWCAENVLKSIR